MNIIKANENVVVDLTQEDIWMNSYEHSVRKNVNKALRNGLEVVHYYGKDIPKMMLESFLNIYDKTMKRNAADSVYFFSEKFFSTLIKNLPLQTLYFFTLKDDEPISCEVVIAGNQTAYSYLGGTISDFYSLRPNDILKHHIIEKLKEKNLKYFMLGGGVTTRDGIFKYKKSFAKKGVRDFFIGKRIHNQAIYDLLCRTWERKNAEKIELYNSMCLRYRM